MKLKPYMLILLLITFGNSFGQTAIALRQIGEFSTAASFSINPAGFLFVSDSTKNEIIKLDTLGNVIKSVGGYGWQESSFDNPVDVYATTLNIYVSDKNNNRIQIFDKDLNFLSQFRTQNLSNTDYSFNYPACSGVSNQGDFFILDSDNKRILKFNSRGDFQMALGSYDAGSFAFSNPKSFAISGSEKILVVDASSILIFDQFGSGIRKFKLPFVPQNINSTFQKITISSKTQVAVLDNSSVESGNLNPMTFNPVLSYEIIDALFFNNNLYVLTKNSIHIFQTIKPN